MTTRPGAIVAAAWLTAWAEAVHERRAWLTDLDAAIGDGDHGINLDRGLAAVAEELGPGPGPDDTAGTILTAAGRKLMGLVGGASGALYGRALIRAGEAVGDADEPALIAERALAAAVDAIVALGKAAPGDKTMLDALVPSLATFGATSPGTDGAARVRLAAEAAETGASATVPLIARRGRASYLGDRSIGHLDPGAASAALLVRSLSDSLATP